MTFSDPPLPDPSARPASGVGRDLPALLALHQELSGNAGGVVFLEGPRGVGKASLLIALRRELATAGRLVLLGRAEHSATAPYAVIREPVGQALAFLESRGLAERFLEKHATALGVVLPKLGLGVPAQARDKMSFFESMRAFFLDLAEVSAPTLLLTDAHDADDDTRELIRFLAVHLFHPDGFGGDPAEGFSGVMMIASRTDDEEGARAVAQLRGGQRMREFLVSGMQKSELMDYLASHPAMEKLLAASHGRPEDVDELLDALPPNTDELLYRRIDGLASAEQITLNALAVLGRPASPDLVSSVLQRPISGVAQALSSLVEHRLLSRRLHNGELLFTFFRPHHQDVLRLRLDEKTKRELHLAIGLALEQRGGGSDHNAILAYHFLRGATPERGVPYALAASERLLVTFAYGSATEMVQTALPHADPEQRFALLGQLVEAERLRGQLAHAQEAASQMQAIATAEQLPQVLRRLAELSSGRGEQRKALEILREALSLESSAKDEESLPEKALVLAAMSEVSYGLGELEDAGRFAADALDSSSGNVQMSFRLRIDNTVAKIAYSRERFEEAEALFLENLRLAEVNELETEAMQARVNIGLCRFRLGRYDSAREVLERALGQARAAGDLSYEAQSLLNLGAICQRTSDIARAIRYFQGGFSLFSRMGKRSQVRLTAWNLANVYIALGMNDAAASYLEESKRIAELEDSDRGRAFILFSEGDIAFDQGRYALAYDAYENARVLFESVGDNSRVVEMATKSAWTALRRGEDEVALRRLGELSTDGLSSLALCRRDAVLEAGYALQPDAQADGTAQGLPKLTRTVDELLAQGAEEDAWRTLGFIAFCYEREGDLRSAEAARARAKEIIGRFSERLTAELRETFVRHAEHAVFWSDDHTVSDEEHGHLRATMPGDETGGPRTDFPSGRENVDEPARSSLPTLPTGPSQRVEEWDVAYPEMVGASPALLRVFDRLDRIAKTRGTTVLIRGESGTGKELVAGAIHRMGERRSGPFVRVNCAALVETLLLSELFGHEKGSFTGAFARKVGRFEMARGGTLFLDEIGDISPKTQVSLLRVLQERSFERVGGTQTIQSDAAVICATHRDLEAMVAEGTFREDLYYRLRGVVVEVPALRERPEDISLLVQDVLRKSREELGRAPHYLSPDAEDILMRYRWPGNIRELQNVIRSVALFCEGNEIRPEHLAEFPELFAAPKKGHANSDVSARSTLKAGETPTPKRDALPSVRGDTPPVHQHNPGHLRHAESSLSGHGTPPVHPSAPERAPPNHGGGAELMRQASGEGAAEGMALGDMKRKLEFDAIANAMRQTGGNITKAAALLKMKRPRLSQIVNGDPKLKAIKEQSRLQYSS